MYIYMYDEKHQTIINEIKVDDKIPIDNISDVLDLVNALLDKKYIKFAAAKNYKYLNDDGDNYLVFGNWS